MADSSDATASPSTDAHLDGRIDIARLIFGADTEWLTRGTTIALRNYLLDGKLIQVSLSEGGRIEQRDTASHIAKISNLTIKITVNGMPFEIDQHAILSTPNDLIYAINGSENEVQVLQRLSQKLEGVDTIAMVHFKYFLNTGIVDTSKGQSVIHVGPSKEGYKLSVQIACLRLAVILNATRFLQHLVKEIEYVWISHDLDPAQLLALVEVAPYLDKLLVFWTFVTPARNLAQKDCFISSALANLPHFRNIVRQHATSSAGRPMMPSLHSFLTGIAHVPNINSLSPQPSVSDTNFAAATLGLKTPSISNGNVQEDNDGKDSEEVMDKQPRQQNGDRE